MIICWAAKAKLNFERFCSDCDDTNLHLHAEIKDTVKLDVDVSLTIGKFALHA